MAGYNLVSAWRRSYMFSLPLHAIYVSWKLIPSIVECPFMTIQDMTFAILYWNSLYRSAPWSVLPKWILSCTLYGYQRGVLICPELFSTLEALWGQTDFFIPVKKWVRELTWEGSKLGEYSSHFGLHGAYGEYLNSGDIGGLPSPWLSNWDATEISPT